MKILIKPLRNGKSMNMNLQWQWLRKVLKNMDEKQLLELFHDIDDFKAIERIADCAYQFVENYEKPTGEHPSKEWGFMENSDEKDWSHADDAQRYNDIKSTQDTFK